MAQVKSHLPANQFTVVNLSRDQLMMCSTHSIEPIGFKLPSEVVADLEVVNPGQLEALIKAFITQQQLPPTPIIITLAPDVYFEKELTGNEADWVTSAQEFLDSVPLISPSSKVFKVQNNQRLIVINRHLYELVKRAFEDQGFSVVAVTPAVVLADIKISDQLTAQSCRLILHKVDYIKQNSFMSEQDTGNFGQKRQRFFQTHQTVLGVLSIMFVAFSIAMSTILLRRPTNQPVAANQSPPRISSHFTTPTPVTNPVANFSLLSVMIFNGSATSKQASQLQDQLKPLGFASVQTANASSAAAQTLIIFSPSVTTATRTMIIDEVKKNYPDLSSQENSPTQYDVIITLGQTAP